MKYLFSFLSITLLLIACEKDNGGASTLAPRLVIVATPSDSSDGKVEFAATAPNATGFSFDFGDGTLGTAGADGKVTHAYTTIGSRTYYVVVSALNGTETTDKRTIQVQVEIKSTLTGLIWADEFGIDGRPNPVNWTFEIGDGTNNGLPSGWGNNEKQFYTDRSQNATVSGGFLKINLIKESFGGASYTSARLITQNKFEFKYGRVEVRAKLPAGGGTWPAIWMLGADINQVGWPACGEIDIMEHRGNEPNKIHGTLHYPGRSGGNPVTNTTTATNVSTTFHVYKVDWSAASIKFYVDDNMFFNVPNTPAIPFNKDFFMILNVAMGGTFGGAVDPAFTNSSMEIDYVRVFSN